MRAGVPLIVPRSQRRRGARRTPALSGCELHGDRALHRAARRFATSRACAPCASRRIRPPAVPAAPGSTSCSPAKRAVVRGEAGAGAARSSRGRSRATSCRRSARSTMRAGAARSARSREETRKMLDLPELSVSATAVRVPGAHRALAKRSSFETERATSVAELAAAFEARAGHRLSPRRYRDAARRRGNRRRARGAAALRSPPANAAHFALWCVGDQLRKGAATNARADPRAAAGERIRARMNATARVAVLKFGGTSVATRERREVAYRRVRDARDAGFATVAVVSAMGRAPGPYATDTLLALLGGRAGSRQRRPAAGRRRADRGGDLCRRAQRRRRCGGRAVRRAGRHRDRRRVTATPTILRVEPHAIAEVLERGVVPVVAGFQGATGDGVVTTLGRGGTDLSAIAIGHALEAAARRHLHRRERRDDGRSAAHRAGAHDRARVARRDDRAGRTRREGDASQGRRLRGPHRHAATRSRACRPTSGRMVDEGVDHHRPVTGVTSSGRVTWVRVIRGDIESPSRRMQTELEMFRRARPTRRSRSIR